MTPSEFVRTKLEPLLENFSKQSCKAGYLPFDDAVALVAEFIEPLIALLRGARRDHYHCDDSWYCCRACRCVDHGLEEGEHLGAGHDDPRGELSPGTCTCGADAWNARVDAALAGEPVNAPGPEPEDAGGEANDDRPKGN